MYRRPRRRVYPAKVDLVSFDYASSVAGHSPVRPVAFGPVQISLLGEPDPPPERSAASAPAGRLTSKGIAPGDIVEIDRKGRRFHALVERIEQRDSGRFDLGVRPLDGRSTWRSAPVREVVGVWRRAKGAVPTADAPPETPAPPGAAARPAPAAPSEAAAPLGAPAPPGPARLPF
jgi:hypothetical protein